MSTSTIENIAIGTRNPPPKNRGGRHRRIKKNFQNISFDLSELLSPAHARAWQASLKESFTNPQAFDIIMQDMSRLNTEFEDYLASSSSVTPLSSFSPSARYQDYVNSFISLFAQSKFASGQRGHTEIEVTEALFAHKCPKMKLFRRIAVNPAYIADENPENQDKLVSESGSVPIAQLARMCDVAILKFLSTVTENTDVRSIVWALDYLAEVTKRLEISLRTQSEIGWCGITFRKRKDTVSRRSVIELPQLAVDGRPLVVGLSDVTLPPQTGPIPGINPETGQQTHPPIIPSIAVSHHEEQIALELEETTTPLQLPSHSPTSSIKGATGTSTDKIDGIRRSIMETPSEVPTRRHSVTTSHPSREEIARNRSDSAGSRPSGPRPSSPKRKTSMTVSITPFIEPISEESPEREKRRSSSHSESDSSNDEQDFLHFGSERDRNARQPSPGTLRLGLASIQPVSSLSCLDYPSPQSNSPIQRSLSPKSGEDSRRPGLSTPGHASPLDFSDVESDRSDEPPVRQKNPEPRGYQRSPSPTRPSSNAPVLTDDDIMKELDSCMNCEGRLSLLAILKAILHLPSNQTLWTEDSWDACRKCFSLIQFCMDFGLDASKKHGSRDQKKSYHQQPPDGKLFNTYSQLVLQYAIKALIHCAVSTYTGCSSDGCLLGTYSLQRNSRSASQNLNKLIHQLERLYSNNPLLFRMTTMEFARQSTLNHVFHFLHVILQYCPRGGGRRDPLDPSSSRRDPLIVMSAAVFRIIIDRLALLDLTEPALQHNIPEALSFVHFATTLFNQDFIINKGFHHLHKYVQRVALSILLPLPPPPPPPSKLPLTSPLPLDMSEMGTFPRRKDKRKESESSDGRKRVKTFTSSSAPVEATSSPLPHKKNPRPQRKGNLTKQASLHKEPEPLTDACTQKEHPAITAFKEEWRGLKIGVLHQRIRRLTLLLELSEPGVIPDMTLLSSLFHVGPHGSVVPRALVLMECALFVHQLNNDCSTVWLSNQPTTASWDIFYLLRKWADGIGEGLKDCILNEKELLNKLNTRKPEDDQILSQLIEEPIFPDEEKSLDKHYIVNYSLKMMACVLLLEITKFLHEPPPRFLPPTPPAQPQTVVMPSSNERKYSNVSSLSIDSDTLFPPSSFPNPNEGRAGIRRMSSEHIVRHSSGAGFEDLPRFLSVEQQLSSTENNPSSRKVSIFLRVNNRYGRQTHPHSHGPPVTHRKGPGYVEVPSDTYHHRVTSPSHSPNKLVRRMSSVHHQTSIPFETHNSSIRHHGHITRGSNIKRRMSFAGSSARDHIKRDKEPHTHQPTRQPSIPSSASHNLKVHSQRHQRTSVISRVNGLFQRGRQIALRRPHGASANKKRPSTTTQTSSAGSSPSTHRRILHNQLQQESTIFNERLEDIRTNFPWLDVVQHIVVSAHEANPELKLKRKQSCNDLMIALKRIYSLEINPPEPENVTNGPIKSTTLPRPLSRIAVNNIFSEAPLTPLTTPKSQISTISGSATGSAIGSVAGLAVGSVTGSFHFTMPNSSQSDEKANKPCPKLQGLAKLDFSELRLRSMLEKGSIWGGLNNEMEVESEVTLDQLIEIDSAYPLEKLMTDYNQQRLEYCTTSVAGLLHAPFSLLTYAGPVLSPQVFKDIREVAWEALLDSDYNCADAAASFFLLSCAKEKESSSDMQSIVKRNVKLSNLKSVKDAITRFKVLWRCRDSVWPRMENSAPTLFTQEDEKQTNDSKSIGYSLPSHLMGSPGEKLPHPPWQPQSVCSHKCTDEECLAECYQSTHHAPLIHLSEIKKKVLPFSVTETNILPKNDDNSSSTLLELDREDYEQGIFTVKEYHKFTTLFPNALLPLINFIIRALSLNNVSMETTDAETTPTTIMPCTPARAAEAAEEALLQCMLEHPQSLFSPLLNQFNTLYQIVRDQKRRPNSTVEETAEDLLGDILKPFHVLLCHFSTIPPNAAHYLFNHLIGIIMRHTEQPLPMSDSILQSLLCLLRMVVPSVRNLSMKELKNQLKKESCYTTILTTARIRGIEKVQMTYPLEKGKDPSEFTIESEDMTFVLLIAKVQDIDPSSPEFLSAFHSYYLTDEKKNLPVLSSLIIQDHYSVAADGSHPVFCIHEAGSTTHGGIWSQQLQMLLTHKMAEISRVMFVHQMLNDSQTDTALTQRFSDPNSVFIYEELLKLSSFPRKTLDSVPYEVGPAALQKWHLRVADTMLRGVWSTFILALFGQMKDYKPDENIILFLTVLNGSLLLQSEDHTILRTTLAALLTAAAKFESVFRANGYQMIVPSLVQVYALHLRNKMVTDAIKFVWIHFYWLNKNVFLLQAISSIANLFKPEVSVLSTSLGVNYSPLKFVDNGLLEEQHLLEKATMALMSSLNSEEDSIPNDNMDILGACPKHVKYCFMNNKNWSSYNLDQMLTLCVTVASYNPEVLRGMQVLVFLDHLMPLLVKEFEQRDQVLVNSIKSLIKGCEAIKKYQGIKSDLLYARKGGGGVDFDPHQQPIDTHDRMSSFMKQLRFFRERSGTSQELGPFRDRSVSEFPPVEHAKYYEGFRTRRINDVNQDILWIARDSLLSIAAYFVAHTLPTDTIITNRRSPLDTPSLVNLASIVEKVIRLGAKVNCDHMLVSKGLTATLLDLFPNVEWVPENIGAFTIILERAVKLFKKIQLESQKERVHLSDYVWEGLKTVLKCFCMCIEKHPSLITDNEAILTKLKSILEMCLIVKASTTFSTSASTRTKPQFQPFIFDAPYEFTCVLVNLISITLATTHNRRHRVFLRTLFSGKLHFKDTESSFVWKRLFLPLAVKIGLREDSSYIDEDDILFIMETIFQMGEQIHYIIKYRSSANQLQIKRFFTDLKVLICAYEANFSLELWLKVGHEILTLATKYDFGSSHRYSAFGDNANEMYIFFCSIFLDFLETFLLLSRVPIFPIIWHTVHVIEKQLTVIQQSNTLNDIPPLRSTLMHCLQKCTFLSQNSALNPVSLSKQELLNNLEKEFLPELHITQKSVSEYHSTDVSLSLDTGIVPSFGRALEDPYQQQQAKAVSAKRRNSKPPNFPVILEAARETDATVSSGENDIASISELKQESPMHPSPHSNPMLHKRPTTLSLKETEDFYPSLQERKKKGILKQSPAASVPVSASSISPRQMVGFVNETLKSPDAKPFEHTSVRQKATQEKDEEGEEVEVKPMLQHHRRVPRSEQKKRQMKVVPQNSTDADGEESGLDTPRSSISYPGPISSSVSPVQSLENEVLPLTIAAEVHSSFTLSPLSSSIYKSPESTSPLQQPHKLSPQLSTSEEPKVSDDNLRQRRPRLLRETSIHSDQDQPDEQTGQPREERSRLANKEHEIEDTAESVVKTQTPSPKNVGSNKKVPPPVPQKPQNKSPGRTKKLYEKGLSESLNYFPSSSISQYSRPTSVNVESDEEETSGL